MKICRAIKHSWRNMNTRFLPLALLAMVAGCTERTSLGSDSQFSGLVGTTTILQRDVFYWPANADSKKFDPEVAGTIHDKVESNDWRTSGWIRAGEPIRILEINRYWTDTRGKWIGVICEVPHPESKKKIRVRYCWSSGMRIRRAPWEPTSMPESRSASALQHE